MNRITVLILLALIFCIPGASQNECVNSGLTPLLSARDTADIVHQIICFNTVTSNLTFPSLGSATITGSGLTINGSLAVGKHLNITVANSDTSGSVGLIGGSASLFFSTAFSSSPNCVCSNTSTVGQAPKCIASKTGLAITGNGSDIIAYICVGNPS